mmetsp:Transcript_61505/g.123288  ORF Transcript_61505/g.123288 Transcript_61505/m.123288 type:complete len:305 (+) Transcript_61505:88-1002(+)
MGFATSTFLVSVVPSVPMPPPSSVWSSAVSPWVPSCFRPWSLRSWCRTCRLKWSAISAEATRNTETPIPTLAPAVEAPAESSSSFLFAPAVSTSFAAPESPFPSPLDAPATPPPPALRPTSLTVVGSGVGSGAGFAEGEAVGSGIKRVGCAVGLGEGAEGKGEGCGEGCVGPGEGFREALSSVGWPVGCSIVGSEVGWPAHQVPAHPAQFSGLKHQLPRAAKSSHTPHSSSFPTPPPKQQNPSFGSSGFTEGMVVGLYPEHQSPPHMGEQVPISSQYEPRLMNELQVPHSSPLTPPLVQQNASP